MGKSNFGIRFENYLLVISGVTLTISLWSKGLVSEDNVILLLVLFVFAAAINSIWVKLIITFFGLGFFILEYVNFDLNQFYPALVSIIAILIGLFGLYMIVGGMRK